MFPINNMANYGRDLSSSVSTMAALLMLDYTLAEKNQALINFVQTGIDLYWMSQTGTVWYAGDRFQHDPSRGVAPGQRRVSGA